MPQYFIAILPPPKISKEILNFQQEIERKFGAVHAQKAPPHITIVPPFRCEKTTLDQFIDKLCEYLNNYNHNGLELKLDNFQKFDWRTLFVDVAKNETFEQFCKNIKQLFNRQKIIKQREEKHFFVPHLTIANKDLKKRDFKLAWEYFKNKNYQCNFKLSTMAILQHDEKRWNVVKEITFES